MEIKWSSRLKECLIRNQSVEVSSEKIFRILYRPFSKQFLYFDSVLTHRQAKLPKIFPAGIRHRENVAICVGGYGRKEFAVLASSVIPDANLYGDPQQSFPFYTYNEDGTNREENITNWALKECQSHYKDKKITKWDIFHYVYGILQHADYREKYKANLKRELPRIPFAPDFWGFSNAGKRLTDLHTNYEDQKEFPLEMIENKNERLNWRVEKMKLSKDKTQIIYNSFLSLGGIPPEAFEYRLGNRSALDWIIDQYQVKTDKRSGIVNDPNREGDPDYIVRLIKKVVTISLETNKIVKALPELGIR